MNNQYALINTDTNRVLVRVALSTKEAEILNDAFNLNAINKRFILASELLSKFAEYKSWPSDFDGAHDVVESRKGLPYDAMGDYSNIEPSKEQERLDNFNKNNPTNNLQDLM